MDTSTVRARRLRGTQTAAETALWRALRNRQVAGWKFRRQWPVEHYVADFICLDARLIVEVDGATHSTAAELRRDAERSRALEACGYHLLRVLNADVRDNLPGVLDTILAELEHRVHL